MAIPGCAVKPRDCQLSSQCHTSEPGPRFAWQHVWNSFAHEPTIWPISWTGGYPEFTTILNRRKCLLGKPIHTRFSRVCWWLWRHFCLYSWRHVLLPQVIARELQSSAWPILIDWEYYLNMFNINNGRNYIINIVEYATTYNNIYIYIII